MLLPGLTEVLRPAVRVIRTEKKPELPKAASYLRTHKTKTTLADLRAGRGEIPRLQIEKGRMYLVGADGKTDKYLDSGRSRGAGGPSGSGNSLDKRIDHRGISGNIPRVSGCIKGDKSEKTALRSFSSPGDEDSLQVLARRNRNRLGDGNIIGTGVLNGRFRL